MSKKKYLRNLGKYIKKEDKRQKLTVLISPENKERIKKMEINASRLIDDFLSDFFDEVERNSVALSEATKLIGGKDEAPDREEETE